MTNQDYYSSRVGKFELLVACTIQIENSASARAFPGFSLHVVESGKFVPFMIEGQIAAISHVEEETRMNVLK